MHTPITLEQIAKTTLKASATREASYVKGTFRYDLSHHEAVEKALAADGVTDPAAIRLIAYLVYGEGNDVCRAMLDAMKVQA